MKKLIPILLTLSIFTGCAAFQKKVPVHPGSINNIDSYAYDSLLIAQQIISGARADYLAGNFAPSSKDALNRAIAAYNVSESSWQSYHAGTTKDSTALQQAIEAMQGAVSALIQLKTNAPPAVAKPVGKILIPSFAEVS